MVSVRRLGCLLVSILPVLANPTPNLPRNGHPAYDADRVISNATIYTMDRSSSVHHESSIAIKDGLVTWIGSNSRLPQDLSVPVIDANGYSILPGLIDSHVHMLSAGRAILRCNLNYEALSAQALRDRLQVCLDNADYRHQDRPEDTDFLVAVAWDRSAFLDVNGRDANAADLAGLDTNRPIVVITSDVHTALTNARGLEISGFTENTPNPNSGKILHFPNGTLTGVFEDAASIQFFNDYAYFTDQEYADFALAAMKIMAENGITTIMDAGAALYEPAAFKANLDADTILTRSHFCQALAPAYMQEDLKGFIRNVSEAMNDWTHDFKSATKPSIVWKHFKALMDGIASAPAETAAMTQPYNIIKDGKLVQGNITNTPNYDAQFLAAVIKAAQSEDKGVHIHSIGDNSTLQVLEALESLGGTIDPSRVAIAHLEFLNPKHWPRILASGAKTIMTFQWAQNSGGWNSQTGDYDTAQALGPERMAWAEPWGNLTNMGNQVVYGSDYPVDPFDPWLALKVAVSRRGDPLNPISAANMSSFWTGPINGLANLSREHAMRGMTSYGAAWLNMSSHIGSLEVGKYADLIITRDDFFRVDPSLVGQNKVLATILGGKATYLAPDIASYGISMPALPTFRVTARSLASLHDELWHPQARRIHEEYDKRIVNKRAYLGRVLKARAAGDSGSLSCGCAH